MPADVLTKLKCERESILDAMSTGFWKLQDVKRLNSRRNELGKVDRNVKHNARLMLRTGENLCSV